LILEWLGDGGHHEAVAGIAAESSDLANQSPVMAVAIDDRPLLTVVASLARVPVAAVGASGGVGGHRAHAAPRHSREYSL
jgi:hypothetical protein